MDLQVPPVAQLWTQQEYTVEDQHGVRRGFGGHGSGASALENGNLSASDRQWPPWFTRSGL
jgi:hypothetical protein